MILTSYLESIEFHYLLSKQTLVYKLNQALKQDALNKPIITSVQMKS